MFLRPHAKEGELIELVQRPNHSRCLGKLTSVAERNGEWTLIASCERSAAYISVSSGGRLLLMVIPSAFMMSTPESMVEEQKHTEELWP